MHRRDKFLARVFGIFSEDIIRIWCKNPNSPYMDLGRPTVYLDNKKHYTLDFALKEKRSGGFVFITEMKCEIQYENYKYLRLTSYNQLNHHKNKAFKILLDIAESKGGHKVKVNGESIDYQGAILVWGATIPQGVKEVQSKYKFHDVLSTEIIINDLVEWEDTDFIEYINKRREWCTELFVGLAGRETKNSK